MLETEALAACLAWCNFDPNKKYDPTRFENAGRLWLAFCFV
jgi:hypothetical protein